MRMTILISFYAIFLMSCDVTKSIILINKSHQDLTIVIPHDPVNQYFQCGDTIHLHPGGEYATLNLYLGFGKWQKSDIQYVSDFLEISSVILNHDPSTVDVVNPDLLRIRRTGIFGNYLEVSIIKITVANHKSIIEVFFQWLCKSGVGIFGERPAIFKIKHRTNQH